MTQIYSDSHGSKGYEKTKGVQSTNSPPLHKKRANNTSKHNRVQERNQVLVRIYTRDRRPLDHDLTYLVLPGGISR